MIDTFMEWATSFWGITVLACLAWFAVSCVFCLALGSIMAKFGGDGVPEPHREDIPKRIDPRRAVPASGALKRQARIRQSNPA